MGIKGERFSGRSFSAVLFLVAPGARADPAVKFEQAQKRPFR
jgi:hypothetical protein